MKFLTRLWNMLMGKFPKQMHKITERKVSEIFYLEDGTLTYEGDFNKTASDIPTTEKLEEDEHLAVAGHSVEIAKVPIVGGVEKPEQAVWMNTVDSAVWSAAEIPQLVQVFKGKVAFYHNGNLIPVSDDASRYELNAPALAEVGNYTRFVPSFLNYTIKGEGNNEVIYKLPDGAVTDQLGGTATYKIGVRVRKIGFQLKGICGGTNALYQVPVGCEDTCNCSGTTGQASFAPKMVLNDDKDFGILI